MAEPKTRPTAIQARDWLAAIPDESRRKDCARLIALMKRATGEPPVLWGGSIVGFGRYLMTYASGKTLDWPLVILPSSGMRSPGFTRAMASIATSFTAIVFQLPSGCLILADSGVISMRFLMALRARSSE